MPFIISIFSYDDIKATFGEGKYSKEDFEKHSILFQEDKAYIQKIFEKASVIKNKRNDFSFIVIGVAILKGKTT